MRSGLLVGLIASAWCGGCVGEQPCTRAGDWARNATEHRRSNGEWFDYQCPANGCLGMVWGTDVYSDDSNVCTAAVHAGAIVLADGGMVSIEILDGLDSYEGSTRNGVTTRNWGSWSGSFRVRVGAPPADVCAGLPGWNRCDLRCTTDSCEEGYTCVPVVDPAGMGRGGEGVVGEAAGRWPIDCRPACDPAAAGSPCAADAVCLPLATDPSRGACAPRCASDDECGHPDFTCDAASGRCVCRSDDACRAASGRAATCSESGACICTPRCGGRLCGDDGCGGSCGECPAGAVCTDGVACAAPSCGSDPTVFCSDTSACPANSTCTGDGGCVCGDGYVAVDCAGSACADRPDGRGGACLPGEWWCARCTRNCIDGRECGPDGCGGICVPPFSESMYRYGAVFQDGCWQDYELIARQHSFCNQDTGQCELRACNCDGRECGSNTCGAREMCGNCEGRVECDDERGWCMWPSICDTAYTCEDCLRAAGYCGWCAETGRCLDVVYRGWDGCGDPVRATCDRSCSCDGVGCGYWRRPDGSSCETGSCGLCPINHRCDFDTGVCHPIPGTGIPCSGHTTCDACVDNLACGFCRTDGRCAAGDYAGPRDGMTCADWVWDAWGCMPWTPPACSCWGIECGPDSCGAGSCGVCAAGVSCVAGTCGGGTSGGGVPADCTNLDACLSFVSESRGTACGLATSFEVTFRNTCAMAIGAKVSVRNANGTCSPFLNEILAPGATIWGYSCNYGGSYRVAGRAAGDVDYGRGCYDIGC